MSEPEHVTARYGIGTRILARCSDGAWLPAAVIEEHEDGTVTVAWEANGEKKTTHIT
jgi:hypothetical protein